jgi:hypothetical protein
MNCGRRLAPFRPCCQGASWIGAERFGGLFWAALAPLERRNGEVVLSYERRRNTVVATSTLRH